MRIGLIILACLAALLGYTGSALGQAVPDAPQPQKKAATPPKSSPDPSPAAPQKDENAFPETLSRQAAEAAAHNAAHNAAPDAADDAAPQRASPAADANPFPEAVSRSAAKAAEQDSPGKTDLPPGVSSSQSQGSSDEAPVNDPARAIKDAEVGSYYLKTSDYRGALLRYQDATAADPTNVDAIFGLAETQRALGKKLEAAREYQLYLDIVPNGPKAKEARKALKSLPPGL